MPLSQFGSPLKVAGREIPQQLDPGTDSSTRRFFARPCDVAFEAIGSASPNPLAEIRLGCTPCEMMNSITFSARFCDRIWFEVIPSRRSAGPIGALSV